MIIKYREFVIRPCEHAPGNFDLTKIIKRRKKGDGNIKNPTGEEYDAEIEFGYGMTLESCFEKIIHVLSSKELDGKEISVSEYLETYIKNKNEIKIELDKVFNIKIN